MDNIRKIADTAMLAGEILLKSGSDIYRVEDTVSRILKKTEGDVRHDVVAYPTAIYLNLHIGEASTSLIKRIKYDATNLNKIFEVNNISRAYCSGEIDIEEAYKRLLFVKRLNLYPTWAKFIASVGVILCFSILLKGNLLESFLSIFIAALSTFICFYTDKIGFNSISINASTAFILSMATLLLKAVFFKDINQDIIIIASIMTLVPGVKFTIAIKDILNGDYNSGMSRAIEAIVKALGVASGVGAAIAIFGGLI